MATEPETTKEDAKTVKSDMDARRVFSNRDEAIAYLTACSESLTDFGNYPVAAPGVSATEDGLLFDPEVYTDQTRVMVSVLTNRGETPGNSQVKAIVIAPVPTIDAILGNPDAKAWMERIIEKELNHVAVRNLRRAEDIDEVVDSMPKTLEDYITSDRGASGALQSYEELWRPIKNNMAKLSKSWRLAALSKKEMRRGLESAAYASEYYPTLEESKKGSLFEFALKGLIGIAKTRGLDPSVFEKWLENRNEKVIDVASEDEEEFSLEDLAEAMEADKSPKEQTESQSESNETDTEEETEAA